MIDKDGPRENAVGGASRPQVEPGTKRFLAATKEREGFLGVTGLCALRGIS